MVYSIVEKKETKTKQQICKIIEDEYLDACGIIYCATQTDTIHMAFILKQHGVVATFYHAGVAWLKSCAAQMLLVWRLVKRMFGL